MGSDNKFNWRRYLDINEISRYADSHTRELQITIYVVGATGLFLAVRSLRLFTKFTSVNKIPDGFFLKQIKLNGFVRSIEGGEKCTLHVEHIPIMELSYHKSVKGLLPVRLAGLGPWKEPMASTYVANQVLNKPITFQLIEEGPQKQYALAGVYYKPYRFFPSRSLNGDLVQYGLAEYLFAGKETTVVETDPKTGETKLFQPQPVDRKLAERLMEAHRIYERRKTGIWRTLSKEGEGGELVPVPDRLGTLLTAASSSAATLNRGLRYVASAVVFFPAQVKDKIMQRRT